MYDLGVWKVIHLWSKSGLGNIENIINSRIAPADPDRNGNRRSDVNRISTIDHYRNCSTGISEKLTKE